MKNGPSPHCPAGGARYTRALTFNFVIEAEPGAAVRDVLSSLAWRRCRPLSSQPSLVTGTEPVDPSTYVTFFRPFESETAG